MFGLNVKKHTEETAYSARDRLKAMLITDRIGCTDEMLSMLRSEAAAALASIIEIDAEKMTVDIDKDGLLTITVPVLTGGSG